MRDLTLHNLLLLLATPKKKKKQLIIVFLVWQHNRNCWPKIT